MGIPKICDICASPTVEGDYGESKWLCTNKTCKKSNPNWSFNEAFEPYEQKFNELDSKINELSQFKVDCYNLKIELHKARWIGDGSGDIQIENYSFNTPIRFYLDKNEVEYLTDDTVILDLFNKSNLGLRLKEIWELKRQQDNIFWEK